jgi:hypothetical protein
MFRKKSMNNIIAKKERGAHKGDALTRQILYDALEAGLE